MDFADGAAAAAAAAAAAMMGFELDAGFEPQTRARSNTWPCPRPDFAPDGCGAKEAGNESGGTPPQQVSGVGGASSGALLPVKKNSSRRNAWGNLSYADLITQAITSAPDKRLTLSQIYEWMVQNVPYFKDKGDSNSSAGWKNSIRHNLSLHNRFMRVQNEGTGKSSWWMINPDAKPGKSARRRATSMETSKFEKRRGRVKKKVEALRNGSLQADATPSPSSSISEGLDLFPDSPLHPASSFQLSPDFRPRASSNASSCGRLSPIPSVLGEPEWTPTYSSTYSPEQLAGNLAETMKLVPNYSQVYQTSPSQQPQQQQQPQAQQQQQPQAQQQQPQQQQQQQQQQQTGPPPSYFEAQYQRNNALRANSTPFGLPPTPQTQTQQRCPIHRMQSCACQMQQNMNLVSSISPTYQQSEPSPQQTIQQYLMQTTDSQQSTQTQSTTGNSPPDSPIPSTMMGQLMGALNNTALLDDLNINIETLHGFDCDIDEVIKHELLINGTLDINFQQGMNLGNPMPTMVAPNSSMMSTSMPNDLPCDQLTSDATMNHQTTSEVVTAPNSAASPNWVH